MSIKPASKTTLKASDDHTDSAVKCTSIVLHAAINLPGIVTDKTLNQNKLPGGEFLWIPTAPIDGVLIRFKGKSYIVPKANVSTIHVDPEWLKLQQAEV